jgi:16S rRNA (guanine527-N7)-methyltransferase
MTVSDVRAIRSRLSSAQHQALQEYRDMLLQRNSRTNLTAVRDASGVDRRLIDESLRLLPALDANVDDGDEVIDIGTGGGVPGIPLAIARPEIRWTLIDATAKKIAFLQDVIGVIGLSNVVLYHGRAEELAHEPHLRGRYALLTARAVSSLSALMEMGLPLVKVGGTLLLPKGMEIDEELEIASRAGPELGGEIASAEALPDADTGVETRLVIVTKRTMTSPLYPRRSGVPSRSPLGTPQDRD